jgi:ribonucleoside-diphosphate reductase alpha chain
LDLQPEAHVTVQAIAQKYVCSSISKTVNAPKDYTVEQVKKAYELGHKLGLKGMTIFRDGSRDDQVLSLSEDETEVPDKTAQEPKAEKHEHHDHHDHEHHQHPHPKVKGKYDDWTCPNCGGKKFVLQDSCPKCLDCGAQACSL